MTSSQEEVKESIRKRVLVRTKLFPICFVCADDMRLIRALEGDFLKKNKLC